jgi:hypothetical protein
MDATGAIGSNVAEAEAGAEAAAAGAGIAGDTGAGAAGAGGAATAAAGVALTCAEVDVAASLIASSEPKREAPPVGALGLGAATTTGGMSRRCGWVKSRDFARVTELASLGVVSG